MGCHQNITHNTFPRQGEWLGRRVRVVFHDDTEHPQKGRIVRDDAEQPFITLIQLDPVAPFSRARFVLAGECQYAPDDVPGAPEACAHDWVSSGEHFPMGDPLFSVFCTKCDAIDEHRRLSQGNFMIDGAQAIYEMKRRGGDWASTADALLDLSKRRPALLLRREPGERP